MTNSLTPIIGNDQTVNVASASAATANALGSSATIVRIVLTQPGFIEFGSSPTATAANSTYLPADTPEYFVIPTPGTSKIAVIRSGSTDGKMYVSEFA